MRLLTWPFEHSDSPPCQLRSLLTCLCSKPKNRGWVYHSHGLPAARRWELAPVWDYGHLSLAEALVRASDLSPGRFGRGNLREYIIHLGECLHFLLEVELSGLTNNIFGLPTRNSS